MANPQKNSILEQIHIFIANVVCTFDLQNIYLDEDDRWAGILESTYFVVQSTYNKTL